jgi:hypothetical protein
LYEQSFQIRNDIVALTISLIIEMRESTYQA